MADVVPTDLPSWNPSLSNVAEPLDARKISGYTSGETPTAGAFNWIVNFWAQWISYLWARVQSYSTLQGLYAGLSDGSMGQLFEPSTGLWGDTLDTAIDSTTRAPHIGGNGPYLVIATSADNPRVIARVTSGSGTQPTLFTLSRNTAATNSAIRCRGDYCVVASGNRVDLFVISTGVRLWSYNHGAQVYDVDLFGTYVFFGGVTSGGVRVGRIAIGGAGTLDTGYDPGATVYSVCALVDGSLAIIGTSSTAFGGTHGMELIENDLATVRWTRSNAALASVQPRTLGTDGHALYVGGTTGYVSRLNLNDGATTWTFRPTSSGPKIMQLSVDHGGVFAVADDGAGDTAWSRLDKATGGTVFNNTAVADLDSVFSDGTGVFVGQDSASALTSLQRGNRPGTWYRAPAAIVMYTPYPWLTQPVGEE